MVALYTSLPSVRMVQGSTDSPGSLGLPWGKGPRQSTNTLPLNPMRNVSPAKRDLPLPEERSGFSRSGFAPIPHRHSDLPPPGPPSSHDDRERDWDRSRDLPPHPASIYRDDGEDAWDLRRGRAGPDDWDRRPPPPRWEDEYERPKRRRSPSPFGSSHRQRVHSPSPPPHHSSRSQYPDPAELPHSLTFRQFADWFRASHPQTARQDEEDVRRHKADVENGVEKGKERVGMAKRYERYRKEYTSRQLYALYLAHRESPWFLERYSIDPSFIAQRRRVNRQGRVPTTEKYLDALRAGDYNRTSFDFSDIKPGSSSRDHDEPEGLNRALGDAPIDDALRIEVPPAQRQVFIKTVPPSTGRAALEELFGTVDGFQYLALTEPAFKKTFHRVGWAQFKEGVDVTDVVQKLDNSKIDNFVFHMGVNASAVVGKIRLTAPAANTLSRLTEDGEKAKALALKLEEELIGDDDEETENEEANGETKPVQENKDKQSKELPTPGLRERGSVYVQEKIEELLETGDLMGDLDAEQQVRKAKITLDQWLSYLRHGLSTCYYCVASMAFPEELHRKCISHMRPHPSTTSAEPESFAEKEEADEEMNHRGEEEDESRRDDEEKRGSTSRRDRERGGLQKTEDEKWAETLDSRLRSVLDPEPNLQEFGGRNLEDETHKLTAPLIKQEEASKYRCKECQKLFKAPEFVVKHITTKHGEKIKAKLDELATFNNYVLDPQRLQPTPTVLAAVNDALPTTLPLVPNMPFPVGTQFNGAAFNPAMAGNGGPGMDRMMQQQMMMMMQMQQAMMMAQNGGGGLPPGVVGELGSRLGGFGSSDTPPGPPAQAGPEDPRAKRGRVSYQDLDEPGGGGDGGLPY